jgi:hypothetical protein
MEWNNEQPPAGLNSNGEVANVVGDSPYVWRERNLVVIRRGHPLPPVCLLSGELATHIVRCVFHWQEQAFRPRGGHFGLIATLFWHYYKHVWKAVLDIPMSDSLWRKRRVGWIFAVLAGLFGLATAFGVFFGQLWIDTLPHGPTREWLTHVAIPCAAIGGGVLLLAFGLLSNKFMPMPTVRLKVIRITETEVWLSNVAPSYLAACSRREIPLGKENEIKGE